MMDRRLTLVWLVLSAITLSQLGMDSLTDRSVLGANLLVSCAAIAIALVKARIILRELMEVRHAPPRLRRLADAWVVFTAALLIGCYLVGTKLAAG